MLSTLRKTSKHFYLFLQGICTYSSYKQIFNFSAPNRGFLQCTVNFFQKVHSSRKITPDIRWLSNFWSLLLSKVSLSGPAAFFCLKPFPQQRTPHEEPQSPAATPAPQHQPGTGTVPRPKRQRNPQNLGDPEPASKQTERSCRAPKCLFTCECWPSEGIPK